MKDGILKEVKNFLHSHLKTDQPLLIGFSGGPDSLALLHLLLECRRFFSLNLHLAHVDHGWRKESGIQARELAAKAKELNLPFYLKILTEFSFKGNLEAEARRKRLEFFSEIYQQEGAQALMLAHQADDQAETVLKRILEGSSLLSLGGLKGVYSLEGMQVWRPLLRVSKKALIQWLEKRKLQGIDDPTNRDPKFLRARMRTQIFPGLQVAFGKQATSNLVRLGETGHELKDYLYRKIAPLLSHIKKNHRKITIDLNPFLPIEKIEFLTLCKYLSEEVGCFFSADILESSFEALEKKLHCRKFIQNGLELTINRGSLQISLEVKKVEI
ncbi:MAG: tRNA lysidine(34) synthetase TilS [Chlamydiota bacterium]